MERMLPIPRGGWVRVMLAAATVTVLWAIIAYLVAAFGIPIMDPECYSDIGGRICPLNESRDPNLTHLYDTRWPALDGLWVMLALLASAALAVGMDRFFLRQWEPWPHLASSGLNIGIALGTIGVGIGLLIGGAGFTDARMMLGVTGAGVLACAAGSFGVHSLVSDIIQRATDDTEHAV